MIYSLIRIVLNGTMKSRLELTYSGHRKNRTVTEKSGLPQKKIRTSTKNSDCHRKNSDCHKKSGLFYIKFFI